MIALLLPWLAVSQAQQPPVSLLLPDGTHLTVLSLPAAEAVAVQQWVAVGSADDPPEVPGLGHLLEHLLMGSGDGALETRLAPLGGDLNAFTGADYTRYAALLPPEGLAPWLEALTTRLDDPALSETDLDHERTVVLEELRGRRGGLAGQVLERVDAALWPSHPYGRLARAQEADLAAATVSLAADHLASHYGPTHRHLVVVGPVEAATVAAMLPAAAAVRPTATTPPESVLPPPPEEITVLGVPSGYRVGGLVWPLPAADHPDHWALRVSLELLEAGGGARWLAALPEHTEAVQVGVEVTWLRQGGRVLVSALYAGTRSPERIRAELVSAREHLAAADWLTTAAVQGAQRTISRRLWGASWDLEESARWLGWSSLHQGVARSPAQLAAIVDGLTPADILTAWQHWIGTAAPVPVLLDVG